MTTQREPNREGLRRALAGGQCPEPEVLFNWRDREAGQDESDPLKGHVEACPRCQAELELLREFEEGGVQPHEEADVEHVSARIESLLSPPKLRLASNRTSESAVSQDDASGARRFSGLSWKSWAGLAAALLVAAVYLNLPVAPPAVPVDAPPPATVRSSRLVLTAPLGEIAELPSGFAWQKVADAAKYALVLEEVDGTVLWRVEAGGESVAVPDNIRSLLLPGKRVLWSVSATDSQGRVIAESGRQPLTVQRGGQP